VRCGREETQIDHEEARRDGRDSPCVPEDGGGREGGREGERTMR